MTNGRKYMAPPARAYFFRAIPTITLDTHLIGHILSDICIPKVKGRYFMTDGENQGDETLDASRTSAVRSQAREQLEQLKVYLIVAIGSFGAFVVFALTLMGARLLSNVWPEVGMILKIVAWPVTVLGAICCIGLVVRNTVDFIKFLFKGPPEETPESRVHSEGRAK